MNSSDLRFHIITLGCPKNKVDSRRMRASLLQAGFGESSEAQNSDFVLINSCSFIREAQEETIETVFDSLELKKQGEMKVGLVGCFAERFSSAVKKDIPELDFMVGTGRYHEISDILAENFNITLQQQEGLRTDQLADTVPDDEKVYSYFRIAQGCSRNCAFCILPTIRGGLTPYNLDQLERQYQEEKSLRSGSLPLKEIILVSQDTISSGVAELERIIEFLSAKEEIEWIRLQYLFPDRRTLELLDLFDRYPKLVSYLDIPFQHTAAEILKKMNRPYDTGLFTEIINKAKDKRNDLEVRTSFIVGFPTEGETEFKQLFTFLENNQVDKLALFRYSHEEQTPAVAKYEDNVAEDIKIERINQLRDFFLAQRQPRRQALQGRKEKVIIEKIEGKNLEARRAQDSPEIDEIVFIDNVEHIESYQVGQFLEVTLEMPLEYDWFATIHTDN